MTIYHIVRSDKQEWDHLLGMKVAVCNICSIRGTVQCFYILSTKCSTYCILLNHHLLEAKTNFRLIHLNNLKYQIKMYK